MITDELNDLLTLLAMTVIADKKVFAKEIEVFLEAACTVESDLGRKPTLSRAKLLIWFHENCNGLRSMLGNNEFENVLNSLFLRLRVLPNKKPILDRMLAIAAADDEVHVSEKALMVLAARHWGVRLSAWAA